MTSNDRHWLAGWLEGEGSFSVKANVPGGHSWVRAAVEAASTDHDTLLRAKTIAGGRVHGPYRKSGSTKDIWRWAVCRRAEAQTLMLALHPLMSGRRQGQIARALAVLEENPPRLRTGEPNHGTAARYRSSRYRCRCAPCKRENSERCKQYRQRQKESACSTA